MGAADERDKPAGNRPPGRPPDRNVVMVVDPPALLGKLDWSATRVDKARRDLAEPFLKAAWRFKINVRVPKGEIGLDWWRVGSTSGYALWAWSGRVWAGTLLLNGNDPEDARAIERFAAASESSGLPIPLPFVKTVRESPRPLVAVVLGDSDPAMHLPIFEFSIALSSSVIHGADVGGIEKLGASSPPLGTTLPRDFPPRFCHMLVVNGRPPQWLWAGPDVFRMLPDLQQSVATFRDRLDDSFQSFDERIVLHADDGATFPMRMQWHGVRPGAGMAELVDSKQVGHTLLLLSGREPEADEALIQSLEKTVPSFLRGHFAPALHQFRTGPRPLMVELVGAEVPDLDPLARGMGEALAVAFFRRLGVF